MPRKKLRSRSRLSFQQLESRRLLVGELLEIGIDTTIDGSSVLDSNREAVFYIGDRFELELSYADLRPIVDAKGAFSIFADIRTSRPDAFRPVVRESQTLDFSSSIDDVTGGEITFGLGSAAPVSLSASSFINNPETQLEAAILAMGIETVSVTRLINNDPSNGLSLRIVYPDPFTDYPELTADTSALLGATVVTSNQEVPAFLNGDESQGVNPSAFFTSINTETLPGINVYDASGDYDSSSLTVFSGLGGISRFINAGGLPAIVDNYDPANFDVLRVELEVVAAIGEIEFRVDFPDDSELLLFGKNEQITNDQTLIDFTFLTGRGEFSLDFFERLTTNVFNPADVNYSGSVTLIDALTVLNTLDGSGTETPGTSVDVNGDGELTAADLVRVLNQIQGSTTPDTGSLIELQLNAVMDGQLLTESDRSFTADVGDHFDLELSYQDLRSFDNQRGALNVFANIISSNVNASGFELLISE